MSVNTYATLNYFTARLPANLPAFLCTELIPENEKKSEKLAIADVLLWQTRVFTKYDKEKIGYSGLVTQKDHKEEWEIPNAALKLSTGVIPLSLLTDKVSLLIVPLFTAVASTSIVKGYDLAKKGLEYIDKKTENSYLRILSKSVITIASVSIATFIIRMPFTDLPHLLNLSKSKIALGILAYLGGTFALGTSLKLHEYHNNPRVHKAYYHYLNEINRV